MKIIILHGDDTEKSYLRLKKFIGVAKARSWEVTDIGEGDLNFSEILSGISLFGGDRFLILRDVKKLSEKELAWLDKRHRDLSGNLIIYNEGLLGTSILKSLPKDTKIEEFKLPVLLWNFLDNIKPGNSVVSIKTFHKIIAKKPPEFIFSLIAKHLRDLYWVKIDSGSTAFPPWKIGKLKSQAAGFSTEELKNIIGLMAVIDIKVKTSKADLVSELDLLMIKQLE
jgi:DNA polymerase III delta subunit